MKREEGWVGVEEKITSPSSAESSKHFSCNECNTSIQSDNQGGRSKGRGVAQSKAGVSAVKLPLPSERNEEEGRSEGKTLDS